MPVIVLLKQYYFQHLYIFEYRLFSPDFQMYYSEYKLHCKVFPRPPLDSAISLKLVYQNRRPR